MNRLGALVLCLIAATGLLARPLRGCLRPTLDSRAIQWSDLIVRAKYISTSDPAPIGRDVKFEVFNFEVTDTLDGVAPADNHVGVLHLIGSRDYSTSPCANAFDEKAVGREFVLLLRREKNLKWSDDAFDADPRDEAFHGANYDVLVHEETVDGLEIQGMVELRQQIDDVRATEAQYTDASAQALANALSHAADDTEAQETEHALVVMGIKSEGVVLSAFQEGEGAGRRRLGAVLEAIRPPAILPAMVTYSAPATGPAAVPLTPSTPSTNP